MVTYQVQIKPINTETGSVMSNKGEWKQSNMESAKQCLLTFNGKLDGNDLIMWSSFNKISQDLWAVYCNVDTVKNAMKIAKPLIAQYGAANVQICKIAPSSIEIVFEEQQ